MERRIIHYRLERTSAFFASSTLEILATPPSHGATFLRDRALALAVEFAYVLHETSNGHPLIPQ